MSKKNKTIKISESRLLEIIDKMVNEAVAKEEKAWLNEFQTKKGMLLKENEEQEYKVSFWVERRDQPDYEIIRVKASSEEEALRKAQEEGGLDDFGRHVKRRGARKFQIER